MNLPLQKAILRNDLSSFIQMVFRTVAPGKHYLHNWHIDAIAHALTKCFLGETKRLIITLPPRNLKTIAASVAFPAYLLGKDPSNRVICVSYSQELANRNSLDCKKVMVSDWYQSIFPSARMKAEKVTQNEIMTVKRGFRFATSVGGTLTGRGGNFIIIDDPHKPDEILSKTRRDGDWDWFCSTLLSRLDDKKNDVIILIQQRLHEQDLAGRLLETGDWEHLNLPAISEEKQKIEITKGIFHLRKEGNILHPERESKETLGKMKREMGSYAFAAQYQQRPAPQEGGIIQKDWIQTYDAIPILGERDKIVQSWDTASKADHMNDYSVCTTWYIIDKVYYLVGLVRKKLTYPQLKAMIVAEKERWGAKRVLIEDASAGTSLLADLNNEGDLRAIGVTPKNDKATRLMAVSPDFENGRVRFPKEAPWLADLMHELLTFPNAKHDDQVDSISQFLNWAAKDRQRRRLFVL